MLKQGSSFTSPLTLFPISHNTASSSNNALLSTMCFTSSKCSLFELWRNRLGHPSTLRMIFLNKIVLDLVISNNPCTVYPLAKQRQLAFPSNNPFFNFPFDLIYCDVCGPFSIPIVEDYIFFFLVVVDNCTQATWIYLFKYKYEVPILIHNFFKLLKTQFHTKIKKFCIDHGIEFSISFLNSE